MIGFLFSQGGVAPDESRLPVPRASQQETGGRLIYAVSTGDGTSRLWRWDLRTDRVAKGPFVRAPLAIVNVRSTAHGWLGITSDAGDGVRVASFLGSLLPGTTPEAIGRGDLVTWTDRGTTVLVVEHGPVLDRCHRVVEVAAVQVDAPGRERVLHDAICGDVVSVGRTSLGYFLTILGDDRADVVGAGYRDAGILLRDHGMIDISPGGHMLVTPASEFLPGDASSGPPDPAPVRVSGAAFRYRLFGGRPVGLLVGADALRILRVLAYSDGSASALVVGRTGRDDAALWEVPLSTIGDDPPVPRFVIEVAGSTHAAYANDGTAFVLTGGRLWQLGDHRLTEVEVPDGAPAPDGPIAWILREPTSEP